jgi:hypothetical protein
MDDDKKYETNTSNGNYIDTKIGYNSIKESISEIKENKIWDLLLRSDFKTKCSHLTIKDIKPKYFA